MIAVDPDVAGTGLGRAMTLAGLDWLHRAAGCVGGCSTSTPTTHRRSALYRKLGFDVVLTRRLYLPAATP